MDKIKNFYYETIEKLNLKDFWYMLGQVFTWRYWFVPKALKLNGYSGIVLIKIYMTSKGYSLIKATNEENKKETIYELWKKDHLLCILRRNRETSTMEYSRMDQDNEKDSTFLLNTHKSAKYFVERLSEMYEKLNDRDDLYEYIAEMIKKIGEKFLDTDEFLKILYKLSFGYYFDILDLKNNINFSKKEKKDLIGDFADLIPIDISKFLSYEEMLELPENSHTIMDSYGWSDDIIPTAKSSGDIDAVVCINPTKIPLTKISKDILKKLHDRYFNI